MTAGQLGRDLYTRILARFHESDLACLLTPTMRRLQRTPIPDGPLLGTSGSAWTALLFLSTPTMSGTSSSVGDRARMNPRQTIHAILLANVNSRSRSLYAIACPSVCLSSVCRLSSVTLVHPTQAVQIFGNISTAFGTLAIR